jgi:hypothetical protein
MSELHVPFEIEQHPHRLWLLLGPPPKLDVASPKREPLSERLRIAYERVTWQLTWEQDSNRVTLRQQQQMDLMDLRLATLDCEDAATKLGADPTNLFAAELPCIGELAQELAEYGVRYEDLELMGDLDVGKSPLESPEVKKVEEVAPGTTTPIADAELLEFFSNHSFTFDPATGVATKTEGGTTQTAQLDAEERWVLYLNGNELAREYDTPLYKKSPVGMQSFFQAHHPVQDAWAIERLANLPKSALKAPKPTYQSGEEPSILLRNSFSGTPHQRISKRQMDRLETIATRNYKAERAEVDIDLAIAGVPDARQKEILEKADAYFKKLHDNIKDPLMRKSIFGDFFDSGG